MRPSGEVRHALLRAARDLATPERGPTLQEMAHSARVSVSAALHTVKNMTRAGQLQCISGRRKVSYRNRPVAEYRPAELGPSGSIADHLDLGAALARWIR